MSYDKDTNTFSEEEFDETKFEDGEFEKEEETSGSRTYEGCVSFRYNGIDYDVAVDVTESWDVKSGQGTEYDVDFRDEPEELEEIWDEITDQIIEVIKNAR